MQARSLKLVAPQTAATAANPQLYLALAEARRIEERLRSIDLRIYEPLTPQQAVDFMLRGAVRQILEALNETSALVAGLPARFGGTRAASTTSDAAAFDIDFEPFDDAVAAAEGKAEPLREDFGGDVERAMARLDAPSDAGKSDDLERLDGLCQMLVLRLKQGRDELKKARASRSKWALITTAEEGRRRVNKSLRAALTASARLFGDAAVQALVPEDKSELITGLSVRAFLLELRRDLKQLTENVAALRPHDLPACMRDLRIRLLASFEDAGYGELRARDRFELQGLRARISEWLDGDWGREKEGRELLSDIAAYADLLRFVNNREVLVQHDRAVQRYCLEELDSLLATYELSKRTGWPRFATVLTELRRIRWRDESLDGLVAKELSRGAGRPDDMPQRLAEVRVALAAIRI